MAYPGKCVRIPALACAWKASLSPAGFELVRNLMRINGFLGDLVELPLLMNEFSYNFALYAETEPWGWQLFGHHAVLNCLLAGSQLVLSPVFMGAEPDMIDAGPHRGVKVIVPAPRAAGKSGSSTARPSSAGLAAGKETRPSTSAAKPRGHPGTGPPHRRVPEQRTTCPVPHAHIGTNPQWQRLRPRTGQAIHLHHVVAHPPIDC